jgi:hypothetical protein
MDAPKGADENAEDELYEVTVPEPDPEGIEDIELSTSEGNLFSSAPFSVSLSFISNSVGSGFGICRILIDSKYDINR